LSTPSLNPIFTLIVCHVRRKRLKNLDGNGLPFTQPKNPPPISQETSSFKFFSLTNASERREQSRLVTSAESVHRDQIESVEHKLGSLTTCFYYQMMHSKCKVHIDPHFNMILQPKLFLDSIAIAFFKKKKDSKIFNIKDPYEMSQGINYPSFT